MQGQLVQTNSLDTGENVRTRWMLIALIAFVVGTSFFVTEVDWQISTYEYYSPETDDVQTLVATGSNHRKVAYAAVGLLGVMLLLVSGRQPRRIASLNMMSLATYLLICGASVAWSDDPMLSLKRVATLGFCVVGAIGVAKHLNARDLLNLTIVVASFLVGMGVCTELALGTFKPLDADYRLSGTVHPNAQGAYCAVLALAGFFGARGATRGRMFYLAAFGIGIGLLVLTKSRTCFGGCLVAMTASYLLTAGRVARTFAGVGGPLAVCLFLIASLLAGLKVTSELDQAARLGRSGLESSTGGLNGRIPLWTDLMSLVGDRPLLGYGYNGFWTPTRIYEISREHEWAPSTAHSVPLEVLLNVGLVGGLFFGIAISMAMFQAGRRCVQTRTSDDAFVFALALFALVSGMFESGFAQPTSFDAFVATCGLIYVVMLPGRSVAGTPRTDNIAATRRQTLPVPYGVGGS